MDVRSTAVRSAVEAGLAPIDATKVVGLDPPVDYSHDEAIVSDYAVRWFQEGDLSGADADGRIVGSVAGWYIRRHDARPVPESVRADLTALVAESSGRVA